MDSFDQLVMQYTPMIHKIIQSLNIYKDQEEFFQTGLIGLWEANNRFDAKKGNFTNYAYTYIKGKLLSELVNSCKYGEHNACPEEDYWDTVEDGAPCLPLEYELLLSYCQGLTLKETKWVLGTFLHDLSVREIAKEEKVSPSAVKQWKLGALKKMRAQPVIRRSGLPL
ncbi:sigma factor [Neobacillus soli]|uniref:sigma factor n=1 Tax=Neobacillus soli TaxID=220688 RepID=UPI00082540ED|nr:sigma factor [Neobacillus soli]